jgi:hypothetical protein
MEPCDREPRSRPTRSRSPGPSWRSAFEWLEPRAPPAIPDVRGVTITRNPEARWRSGVRLPDRDLRRRAVAPRVPAAERPAGARFDSMRGMVARQVETVARLLSPRRRAPCGHVIR